MSTIHVQSYNRTSTPHAIHITQANEVETQSATKRVNEVASRAVRETALTASIRNATISAVSHIEETHYFHFEIGENLAKFLLAFPPILATAAIGTWVFKEFIYPWLLKLGEHE